MKNFYYVHNRGTGNPTFRHTIIEDAIDEAIRLSKLTKNNFYVLKPVAHITDNGTVIDVEEDVNVVVGENITTKNKNK